MGASCKMGKIESPEDGVTVFRAFFNPYVIFICAMMDRCRADQTFFSAMRLFVDKREELEYNKNA